MLRIASQPWWVAKGYLISLTAIVIDDSATSRALLRRGLNNAGFEVVGEAGTAEGALELYAAHRPTLIIFDIILPKTDGVTAATALLKACPDANVVICSAIASREKILACRQAGVKYFLLKPVTIQKIAEIAQRIVAQSDLTKPPLALVVGAQS